MAEDFVYSVQGVLEPRKPRDAVPGMRRCLRDAAGNTPDILRSQQVFPLHVGHIAASTREPFEFGLEEQGLIALGGCFRPVSRILDAVNQTSEFALGLLQGL